MESIDSLIPNSHCFFAQMQFKAPPFMRCGIAFHGFQESDLRDMEEMAISNGMFTLCLSVCPIFTRFLSVCPIYSCLSVQAKVLKIYFI